MKLFAQFKKLWFNHILYAFRVCVERVTMLRRIKNCACNNRVLLLVSGLMGDAIVLASTVIKISEYYQKQHKSVVLLCRPESAKVYQAYGISSYVDNIDTFDPKSSSDQERYKIFLRKIREIKKQGIFEESITIGLVTPFTTYLGAAIPARKRVLQFYRINPPMRIDRKIQIYLFSLWYNQIAEDMIDFHLSETAANLTKLLGISNFQPTILPFPKMCEYKYASKHYITVAVDSSNAPKQWPIKKFILLINKLIALFGYDIILTGNNVPDNVLTEIDEAFRGSDKVFNMIGKTSFNEFVEIIRGALFHVGVDSGPIHLAASVGTTAFCLVGVWDYHKLFPYPEKNMTAKTALPISVYRRDVDINELGCAGCLGKGNLGWGNKDCRNRYKAGRPCLCLEGITVDDVIDAIEKARVDGVVNL